MRLLRTLIRPVKWLYGKTSRAKLKRLQDQLDSLDEFVRGKQDLRHHDLLTEFFDSIWSRKAERVPLKRQVQDIMEHLGLGYEQPDSRPVLKVTKKKTTKRKGASK